MIATTVMGVIMLVWCGVTLAGQRRPDRGNRLCRSLPRRDPHKAARPARLLGRHSASARRSARASSGGELAEPDRRRRASFIAFGHSILAMSGEETLAQVYREVESPKLPNFKKAAFIVFVYSLVLDGAASASWPC